ncbi:MAG: CoA ester lyase [Pacificimonas sp.]
MNTTEKALSRPRRSVLYVPGANARAIQKAKTVSADALIFDLEDAVAPEAKEEARENVRDALSSGGYGDRETVVRINDLSSVRGDVDLEMVRAVAPDAVLVPKVSSPEVIATVSSRLPRETQLWIMVETATAVLRIDAIATTAAYTKLAALVVGTNDLIKECGYVIAGDRLPLVTALQTTVLAARAHGLHALDGVFNDFSDEAGFNRECLEGRAFGFDGKTLIHPSQIPKANRAFAPSAADISMAQAVVKAFDAPGNAGKGVIEVEGRMTERLHLDSARATIAIAKAIADREKH